MRLILLIAVVLFSGYGQASAQIFVRALHYRPSGEFGFVMKPLVSAEIGWQNRFSKRSTKRFRSGFSVQVLNMQPRMEVFPTVSTISDGNGFRVLPGGQIFHRYFIGQLNGGLDYAFVHKKDLNIYTGLDVTVGGANVAYTSYAPTVIHEDYDGGGYLGGLRARLGIEYTLSDHFSAFANAHRSFFLLSDPLSLPWAWDFGLGLRYSLE
ncbi:MAG: hypothetical protein WA004_11175 [Saprospiraceae bacterium]